MKPVVVEYNDEEFKSPNGNQEFNSTQTNDGIETPNREAPIKSSFAIADLKDMNKTEEKKLFKYNNLYDKLRKKKDELQQLLS
jgi:hypothetical protein